MKNIILILIFIFSSCSVVHKNKCCKNDKNKDRQINNTDYSTKNNL